MARVCPERILSFSSDSTKAKSRPGASTGGVRPTPVETPEGRNSYEWRIRSVAQRYHVPLRLSADAKSALSPMWKGELPTTIDVAEEQEMTRTNVVASWDGPINVFYTVGLTLEQNASGWNISDWLSVCIDRSRFDVTEPQAQGGAGK